jgi:hypothetical protein
MLSAVICSLTHPTNWPSIAEFLVQFIKVRMLVIERLATGLADACKRMAFHRCRPTSITVTHSKCGDALRNSATAVSLRHGGIDGCPSDLDQCGIVLIQRKHTIPPRPPNGEFSGQPSEAPLAHGG